MKRPLPWSDLCRSPELFGMWVALDNCRYDKETRRPVEGDLVDADEDLAALCGRMREKGRSNCTILRCEEDVFVEARNSQPPPPALRSTGAGG